MAGARYVLTRKMMTMNNHEHQEVTEEVEMYPGSIGTVRLYVCTICGEDMDGDPDEDRAEFEAEYGKSFRRFV